MDRRSEPFCETLEPLKTDTLTTQAFYDEPTSQESPNATRERLADLAAEFVDRNKYLEATKVGKSNGGTPVRRNLRAGHAPRADSVCRQVTPELKLAIKYGRQVGRSPPRFSCYPGES